MEIFFRMVTVIRYCAFFSDRPAEFLRYGDTVYSRTGSTITIISGLDRRCHSTATQVPYDTESLSLWR